MNILYKISEKGKHYYINNVKIPNKIFNKELVNYRIVNREDLIDNLFEWIAQCKTSDKVLMVKDLKELINIDDIFILSSIETNDYLYGNSESFNSKCEEILRKL